MEKPPAGMGLANLATAPGNVAQRLFVIFENRLQLLLLELEEERERILLAIWLSLAAAAFGLLAAITITGLIVWVLWGWSPVLTLAILSMVYAGGLAFCLAKLMRLFRTWETLPATLDQLKKDRECLDHHPS